jgi:toxin ParE1/3/4
LRIERHPAVIEKDLPGIYARIARDSPAAAERVLDAVEDVFTQISLQPEIGIVYPTLIPRMRKVRMLPLKGFSNYLVFYRIEENAVRVLHVVHGARHLPHLFRHDRRE